MGTRKPQPLSRDEKTKHVHKGISKMAMMTDITEQRIIRESLILQALLCRETCSGYVRTQHAAQPCLCRGVQDATVCEKMCARSSTAAAGKQATHNLKKLMCLQALQAMHKG